MKKKHQSIRRTNVDGSSTLIIVIIIYQPFATSLTLHVHGKEQLPRNFSQWKRKILNDIATRKVWLNYLDC